jgi:hypothetical protein
LDCHTDTNLGTDADTQSNADGHSNNDPVVNAKPHLDSDDESDSDSDGNTAADSNSNLYPNTHEDTQSRANVYCHGNTNPIGYPYSYCNFNTACLYARTSLSTRR